VCVAPRTGAEINFVREALFLGTYFLLYEDISEALVRGAGVAPGVAVPIAGGAAVALALGACVFSAPAVLTAVYRGAQA
jgi:hypothetical protein